MLTVGMFEEFVEKNKCEKFPVIVRLYDVTGNLQCLPVDDIYNPISEWKKLSGFRLSAFEDVKKTETLTVKGMIDSFEGAGRFHDESWPLLTNLQPIVKPDYHSRRTFHVLSIELGKHKFKGGRKEHSVLILSLT
tara:strand:+ start:196 stop:600 length:405 start_codon:yes stop_codon:yes gene_type:complete